MICQEVMELMQRYVDDDLNEQETSRMMSHVEECPDCAAMLERLRRLSDGLMQLPKVAPPFSLVDAILPQLELQAVGAVGGEDTGSASAIAEPSPSAETRSSRPRRGGFGFGRIAGVVALGLAIGALLYNQPSFPFGTSGSHNNSEAAMPENSPAQSFKMSDQGGAVTGDMAAPLAALEAPAPSAAAKAAAPSEEGIKEKSEAVQRNAETSAGNKEIAPESAEPAADQKALAPEPTQSEAGQESGHADGGQLKGEPGFNSLNSYPGDMGYSPDGKWRTIASADGLLTIIKAEDGATVFATPARHGMPVGLAWNAESTQLSYTFADENGKETNYVYDVTTGKESTR